MPAAAGLPGAEVEGGVEVVDGVDHSLALAPPRTRAGARLALGLLRLRSFPRGFAGRPEAWRAGAIATLETSGSMVVRSLVLLLKGLCCAAYAGAPRVLRVLGAAPRCELGPNADPPALPPHLDREAMRPPAGEVESCDVVVVGSGAGGAAAARVLAEAGLDVLVVEEGEYYDALTYSRDPLHALATLYRDGGLTASEGRPPIALPLAALAARP